MSKGKTRRALHPSRPAAPGLKSVAATFQEAVALHRQGRLALAETVYREILRAQPRHSEALHLLGTLELQRGNPAAAVDLIGRAIKLNPAHAVAHSNLGNALQELGRYTEALASFDRALLYQPTFVNALYNRGNVLRLLTRPDEALSSYDAALKLSPLDIEILVNRGNALNDLKRHDEAVASHDRALAIKPGFVEAWYNRGNALRDAGQAAKAVECYERALERRPDYAEALYNKGNALRDLKRHDEASTCFERVLAIAPNFDSAHGNLHYSRLLCCDWTDYDKNAMQVVADVRRGMRAFTPFGLLTVTDDASDQLRCSRTHIENKHPDAPGTVRKTVVPRSREKIRIAYLSADFREHAVSILASGVFEHHDRDRFEVTGISFRPEEASELGKRVASSFGRFLDVTHVSDDRVATMMREAEIDIAVDLTGFTSEGRSGIFSRRAAPIQVNYLGFPATTGAKFVDYLIADEFVIPVEQRANYSESIVFLPECFQANDDKRVLPTESPTRTELGLPESGFVFCSFNNSYKLTPRMFDIWMALLLQVPNSVLWLTADTPLVEENLRREAQARAVDPRRLVFSARVSYSQYLARMQLADLFLDTAPFNAGTTASDALWVGLPIITCPGRAFASRMAGSLLRAVGLSELIAESAEDYERLACGLASSPSKLREIRTKLEASGTSSPLFDTARFCRHLELAYVEMIDRFANNRPCEDIRVRPSSRS